MTLSIAYKSLMTIKIFLFIYSIHSSLEKVLTLTRLSLAIVKGTLTRLPLAHCKITSRGLKVEGSALIVRDFKLLDLK